MPTSIRLDEQNQFFVISYCKAHRVSTSMLINKALDLLRKYQLREELRAESEENPERDRILANENFEEYKRIVHEAESI